MNTFGKVDLAFVIDTSGSMTGIFDYLIDNLYDFIMKIGQTVQTLGQFDMQLAIVAGCRKLFYIVPLTTDTQSVAAKLKTISKERSKANEIMCYGLDLAMADLQWRQDAKRIMVMITDEPLSGNYEPEILRQGMDKLIEKLIEMRVLLHVISPRCKDYQKLGSVKSSSIYFVKSREDFKDSSKLNEIFTMMSKSISKSLVSTSKQHVRKKKHTGYIYSFPETEIIFL